MRYLLLIGTNFSIMLGLGMLAYALDLDAYLTKHGAIPLESLFLYASLAGFSGAFLSLWLAKPLAQWATGAKVLSAPTNEREAWLVATVQTLARKAFIPPPELAIYPGDANAFVVGASANSAMVAVSSGLIEGLTESELEAVLAHEISHIASGDMVTLTLIQGVVNTFVIVIARLLATIVNITLRREATDGPGLTYSTVVLVCDVAFSFLASVIVMYFSRQREFKADRGAAVLLDSPEPMIAALLKLSAIDREPLPKTMAALGITGRNDWMALWASHPSLLTRVNALRQLNIR